ncbi:hypothetical protein HDU76_002287 [Blyttiomyces sp. JEL0837]|nr:hypothetical protein HDU76_002287 [Blyttiomyces sp. JEL0837]
MNGSMEAPASSSAAATPANIPYEMDTPGDMTDWGRLRNTVWLFSLRLSDSLIFVVVNGFILILATWLGIIGFLFVGPLLQIIYPRITKPLKITVPTPEGSGRTSETRTFLPSSLTAATPTFFDTYTDKITERNAMETVAAGLLKQSNRRPPFNVDMARLFIHLCALVYENQEYMGVGPFDLSELLLDAMIQKVRPEPFALPGMVHEAFYNLLSFPSPEDETIVETESADTTRQTLDVGELVRMVQEDVLPRLKSSTPAIWFTGHSLGAALSTLIVLYRVVNADDPIVALPLGSQSGGLTEALGKAHAKNKSLKSHTDYKHLGIPVILQYEGVHTIGTDRDLEVLIKNAVQYVGEVPVFIKKVLTGRASIMSMMHNTFPFPHDHLPSEYNRHLRGKNKPVCHALNKTIGCTRTSFNTRVIRYVNGGENRAAVEVQRVVGDVVVVCCSSFVVDRSTPDELDSDLVNNGGEPATGLKIISMMGYASGPDVGVCIEYDDLTDGQGLIVSVPIYHCVERAYGASGEH